MIGVSGGQHLPTAVKPTHPPTALIPTHSPTAVNPHSQGDPVYHYAARIKSLEINGQPAAVGSVMYAVIDTGTVMMLDGV